MIERSFRELDELVLYLKGLVLVRDLRRGRGADGRELDMYRNEIERTRERLAALARAHANGAPLELAQTA